MSVTATDLFAGPGGWDHRGAPVKQYCKRGHDTLAVGRTNGRCLAPACREAK